MFKCIDATTPIMSWMRLHRLDVGCDQFRGDDRLIWYGMNAIHETKPAPPDDAQRLEVGAVIQDGDLHWNATVKHWVAVTPQGEERVEPDQDGFYFRKSGDL